MKLKNNTTEYLNLVFEFENLNENFSVNDLVDKRNHFDKLVVHLNSLITPLI